MTSLNDLTIQAIATPKRFNWPWFIELCVCGILALFFLFYFNRLFATLLSYAIRAYAWHHYRIWVDIQALQISLLGGRIFFKGIRYHGENETIFVNYGYVTWRYWFRSVKQADLLMNEKSHAPRKSETNIETPNITSDASSFEFTDPDEESGTPRKHDNSEARIAVFVTGVEWFIYNRTPLYDAILRDGAVETDDEEEKGTSSTGVASSEALKIHIRSKLRRRPKTGESSSSDYSKSKDPDPEKPQTFENDSPDPVERRSTASSRTTPSQDDVTLVQSMLVQLLPIYIECSRAAVSIGNEHTRALLVTTVDKAKGHIDARGCGPHDLFRQIFEFDVEHPIVQMRPNPDFVGSQLSVAEHIITNSDAVATKKRWWYWNLHLRRRRYKAMNAIRNLVPGMQSSVESLHHRKHHREQRASYSYFMDNDSDGGEWHGLSRYLDDNDNDDHQAWAHIDYARFSTIVDCPSVHLTFYWDSPGRVKDDHFNTAETEKSRFDINGVKGPAYGLDLTIKGGTVNYGPWADRLRAEIQSVFFPASYRSSVPAKPLKVGQWRQSSVMVIRIDIEEEVRLRVPTRESSKDWRWRGRATAVREAATIRQQRQKHHFRIRRGHKGLLGPDVRPFGWISISVSSDSSVRYEMDMTASQEGYRNQLHLDLRDTKAISSINHAELWRCTNQKLQCDLSNPLIWNSQHTWNFNIQNQSMDMFLLRDHMFLLTDLIADFTAGAKSNYMTFVPFEYKIGLSFDNLKLFLNANDFNIIDNPCDLDSNAFLILGLQSLVGNVDIPMKYFSASESSVHFRANGENISLDLKTPIWNTLRSFAKDENMATLKTLVMGGSYNYHSGTSAEATDSLFMDIVGGSPVVQLQGFLIRYFMNVKENYFGEDLHFRTLEEYQSRIGPGNRFLAEDQRRTTKKDNDLDVVLNVRAEESCALMPANIYTREENLRVDVMLVEADMRFTNYYMDLQVNSSPIEVSTERTVIHRGQKGKPQKDTTGCQLYISSATVYGHRLFGAPPTEPTYVCNWDFDIGTIFGECSVQFVRILISAIQAFVFTLDDVENALPVSRATDLNDITFLRARTNNIRIWMVTDSAAFLVETGQSTVSFDDWAGQHFSKALKADVPSITIAAIDSTGSHRSGKTRKHNQTLACIQSSVRIVNIDKKANFESQRQLQQDHVKFHDSRTGRATNLLHNHQPLNLSSKDVEWAQEPASMPIPNLPPPLSGLEQTGRKTSKLDVQERSPNSDGDHSSQFENSGRKQFAAANGPLRTGNSTLAEISGSNSHSNSEHTDELKSHEQGRSLNNLFDAPFTSPWIGPQFTLRQVQPDLSQMPSITLNSNKCDLKELENSGAEQDYVDSDESSSHAAIFCSLPDGVRGFCSPLLFPAIADVLRSLEPNDPHLLLDKIQQSTTANIQSLTAERQGEKIDLALRIPAAAIRLVDPGSHSRQPSDLSADQYDLTVSQIRLNGRIAPTFARQAHGQMRQNIFLLQMSVRGIDVSVAEKLKSPTRDVAELSVSIHDIALWLSIQDEIRSKLQSGYFNVTTGGSTVDRLSMLAERCRVMIASITEQFGDLDQTYAIRHLVYHLSLLNTDEADPVFLSKPNYVLRSTAEHTRLADSWRIIARFRQRLNSMPSDHSMDLVEHESCLFEQQQDKARQQILESIDRWKTWDQNHEACGPLLATMFGKSNETGQALMKVDDIEIGFYIGQISIVLDPGPQQSELLLQSGDINISQKPMFERDPGVNRKSLTRKSRMRVQVWFADMRLNIDWNLIELARSLVKQINLSTAAQQAPKTRRQSTSKPIFKELDLMLIAGTDIATANIRMLNLSLNMATRNVKTSVVVQLFETDSIVSALIDSNSAHLKVTNQQAKLVNWKLRNPTVYGQYQQNHRSLKGPNSARFAASCDRLRFDMKQDIISVLEVVNSVVRDEITIIQEVINSIEQKTAVAEPDLNSQPMRFEDAHVAFFLNNYKLQFCLLPSLHYIITGTVARTSIVPQEQASKYDVHVDIKRNTHTLVEPDNSRRTATAALVIPPLSGRFAVDTAGQQIKINARSTLERVTIEAQAVQACVEAAYQPQNLARLKDCQAIVGKIQQSVKNMQEHSVQKEPAIPPKQESKKVLLYSGHAVFEGFDIHCSAPTVHDQEHRADLKFGLRETTLRIHNYRRAKKIPLAQPHFEVNLRQVYVGLYRQDGRGLRNYGRFGMGMKLKGTTQIGHDNDYTQNYQLKSESLQFDLFAETASLAIDIATFLQGRIIELTTAEDRKKMKPLRRLTLATNEMKATQAETQDTFSHAASSSNFLDATFSLDLNLIQVRWIVDDSLPAGHGRAPEDLVFSIQQIDLQTQRESSARLTILNTQLQTVPKKQADPTIRTANSALLPEMIFNAAHFSTKKDRRFAFQAAGKALDLRLAADGILPISAIQKSLAKTASDIRNAKTIKVSSEESTERPVTNFLGDKRLSSLLVDADFAGAIVTITPQTEVGEATQNSSFSLLKGAKRSKAGRYAQAVQIDGAEEAVLRAPGIAVKVEYSDTTGRSPTLSTELKVAASNNTLAPSVVPLVLEIYSSIKEIIGEDESQQSKPDIKTPAQKYLSDAANTDKADPAAILGKVKLNAGLWVQRQEFSLTCQPIARVAATARFDEIFVRINTVQDGDQERFFSIITTFNKLQTSVQHVYSRESTASFEVDAIVMSLMNSRHISTKNGISAILNVSPMRASLNAKQMQDFLLFREIWYPAELRQRSKPPAPAPTSTDTQAYTMQKYHELAATAALPWHAIVSIHELKLEVDFGQSLGKSSFMISKLWASSKKNSDWEQNLCIGFERVGIDSSGRTSGFIELKDLRARTSIRWPVAKDSDMRAPLVQASVGFGHLRLKTAFDYQPFAVADISSFEFLMYNIRPTQDGDSDRLVGILDGGKVQVFCISAAAGQALSIVQAFERLIQEKREAFHESLQELEKLLRRKSIFPTATAVADSSTKPERNASDEKRESHRLHTDVVVTLKAVDIGAFPNTFFDNQILKIEAVDAQARFAVATVDERLNSGLGMTLGEVRVALSAISKANTKALGEVEISEVIDRATSSKGGTILKVPRVVASMQTWQEPQSLTIEYIFRSTFQGKVDVGWNYSRIRFIRSMWETHSQALAHKLGKPLPPAAVKITTEPREGGSQKPGNEKITAVVNVPQSTKFKYLALEPPIIDTPQLRDMGEATPPLEWIGLHRDKLPNVTHSIIIVTLLEVAKEVEDAYTRILGTS